MLPFFGDACANQNSPMRVKHVTPTQFAAVLKTQVARDITEAETKAIVDAFGDGEMVNFAAFAATVDPGNRPITRTEDRRGETESGHPRPGVVGIGVVRVRVGNEGGSRTGIPVGKGRDRIRDDFSDATRCARVRL